MVSSCAYTLTHCAPCCIGCLLACMLAGQPCTISLQRRKPNHELTQIQQEQEKNDRKSLAHE